MQNIKDLRESLVDNYEKLKNNEMDLKMAKELANTAGKVLNSLKVELEYQTLTGNKNRIEFLES
jgi:hypothetical protein